jgi:hypothetical protein
MGDQMNKKDLMPGTLLWGGKPSRQIKFNLHRATSKLIWRFVLTSPASFVEVIRIPKNYKNLTLIFRPRLDKAVSADNVRIWYNQDTTASNYYTSAGGVTVSSHVGAGSFDNYFLRAAGSTAPANEFSINVAWIAQYSRTGFAHKAYGHSSDEQVLNDQSVRWTNIHRLNAAGYSQTINEIRIQGYAAAPNNMIAGTIMELWGHR